MRGRRDAQTEAGPELDRIPDHSDRKYRDGVETCYPFRFGFLNALLALICIGPPIEHGCPRVGQQQTAHGHHLTQRKRSLGTELKFMCGERSLTYFQPDTNLSLSQLCYLSVQRRIPLVEKTCPAPNFPLVSRKRRWI